MSDQAIYVITEIPGERERRDFYCRCSCYGMHFARNMAAGFTLIRLPDKVKGGGMLRGRTR